MLWRPVTIRPPGSSRFCLSLSHPRVSSVSCVSPWAGRLLGFGGLRWKPSTSRRVCIYLESGGWVPTRAASQTSADLVPGKPQCCLQGGHWGSEPGGPSRGQNWTPAVPTTPRPAGGLPAIRVTARVGPCPEDSPCGWPAVVRGQAARADGAAFSAE